MKLMLAMLLLLPLPLLAQQAVNAASVNGIVEDPFRRAADQLQLGIRLLF